MTKLEFIVEFSFMLSSQAIQKVLKEEKNYEKESYIIPDQRESRKIIKALEIY